MTKLKCWKKTKEFDGIRYEHKTEKLPSGSPKSIRLVTSVGSANYGNLIFGNRKVKHLGDYDKALKFAKSYMKKHDRC